MAQQKFDSVDSLNSGVTQLNRVIKILSSIPECSMLEDSHRANIHLRDGSETSVWRFIVEYGELYAQDLSDDGEALAVGHSVRIQIDRNFEQQVAPPLLVLALDYDSFQDCWLFSLENPTNKTGLRAVDQPLIQRANPDWNIDHSGFTLVDPYKVESIIRNMFAIYIERVLAQEDD